MFQVLKSWYKSLLSDPNSATFFILIFIFVAIIYFFSDILMPLLVALGVAYILEVPVHFLEKRKILSRSFSSFVFMLLFFCFLAFFALSIVPSIISQGSDLVNKIPSIIAQISTYIQDKMAQYPNIVEHLNLTNISNQITDSITAFSTDFIKKDLLGYLMNFTSFIMYLILIPLLAYLMLKDKDPLLGSVKTLFPPNLKLAADMWKKMNGQMMNYISGKFIHIIAISILNFLIFYFCGLNYSVLLALSVGLSVLVPVVGAVIVSVPVLMVAFSQFGIDGNFWTLIVSYIIGLVVDANLLTPFLFSEKMKLHPFTILASVLVFGNLWGFWGVFFAIPLATFIKTIYMNWPRGKYVDENEQSIAEESTDSEEKLQDIKELDNVIASMKSSLDNLGQIIHDLDNNSVAVAKTVAQTKAQSSDSGTDNVKES